MSKKDIKLDPKLKEQVSKFPKTSGVYMMINKRSEIIYIGKAKDLRTRVRSYLNTKSWEMRPKLYHLMPKVVEIKAVVTNSEKEALILESSLVNKHQPRYNVTLKDDKKFPWLMITYDEEYPRVIPIRDITRFKKKFSKTKNKFFGPYSDAGAMWETYRIIKEGFPLRLRRSPLFKDRPCMNYHIGLCSGPCQELISRENYFEIIKQVEDFLMGKYKRVLKDLNTQMESASEKLEYEKAAKFRDTITKINKVLEKQIIVSDDPKLSQDIFACDLNESKMILELFIIREGKVISIESFVVEVSSQDLNQIGTIFTEAVKQYYTRIVDSNIPSEVIVQHPLEEKEFIEDWLSSRINKKIKITHPQKGKKLDLVKMAEENARLSLQKIIYNDLLFPKKLNPDENEKVLKELKESLSLKEIPERVECFDISHLGGTGTVASMVVFTDGEPNKSEYRKFRLKTLLSGEIDDFKSMKEVITRQYKNQKPKANSQKLIVIDGGKGQLSSACGALMELGVKINEIDIISLAKREEEVFKPGEKESILLSKDSEALKLLQRVRNEAHRFAISFQRDSRKKTFESELEKIPGLGPAKVKKLMSYYGSLKNIQESDLETFSNILGGKKEDLIDLFDIIKEI